MKPVLMLTNCASQEEAESIADGLLENSLAAAVQIVGPAESRYRWQGKIHKKQEWMVFIKTSDARQQAVMACIRERHSYALPGIATLAIAGGEARYLQWLLDQSQAT